MPVVTDYTALLSGSYWNGIEVTGAPVIVTYSFPTSSPAYDITIHGFTADTVTSFQAFTSAEQAQAVQALDEWANASGLIFIQVAPGEGDINFGNVDFNTPSYPSDAGYGGIGFYPFGDWNYFSYPNFTGDLDASGDVFMNSQFLNNSDGRSITGRCCTKSVMPSGSSTRRKSSPITQPIPRSPTTRSRDRRSDADHHVDRRR